MNFPGFDKADRESGIESIAGATAERGTLGRCIE
jgi:hypothetical protein